MGYIYLENDKENLPQASSIDFKRVNVNKGDQEILAMMYSLLGCCKTCEINPWEWLIDVLSRIPEFIERYHESLGNLTPADVYFSRTQQIKSYRHQIKMKTLKERRKINRKLSA